MANELSFSVSISDVKYNPALSLNSSVQVTQSGSDALRGTQNVGTSWVAVNLGSIGTLGYLALLNLDATNYVEVAIDNAGTNKFAKLKVGDPPLVLPVAGSTTYYVKANSAACDVAVFAIEA